MAYARGPRCAPGPRSPSPPTASRPPRLPRPPQTSLFDAGALSGICFTKTCEDARNTATLLSTVVPIGVLGAWARMAWVSAGQKREEEMGESMESGPLEWEEGVYRLDGFTLMSVPEGSEGERVRVEGLGLAGQGRARAPQTFFFERTSLRQSVVFATVLERPLGISFEERGKRLVVADIAKGTDAWKKGEVARLSPDRAPDAPMVGDVVR